MGDGLAPPGEGPALPLAPGWPLGTFCLIRWSFSYLGLGPPQLVYQWDAGWGLGERSISVSPEGQPTSEPPQRPQTPALGGPPFEQHSRPAHVRIGKVTLCLTPAGGPWDVGEAPSEPCPAPLAGVCWGLLAGGAVTLMASALLSSTSPGSELSNPRMVSGTPGCVQSGQGEPCVCPSAFTTVL